MKINHAGNYEPVVNVAKCNDCSVCLQVCSSCVDFIELNKDIFDRIPTDIWFGNASSFYIGYTKDEAIAKNCSSGGLVKTLLCHCLENKLIDGALVLKKGKDSFLQPEAHIVNSREEVIEAAKSTYLPAAVNRALRHVINQSGKYAVVGLPCHIHGLRKAESLSVKLHERTEFCFGLFCSHTCTALGIKTLLRRLDIPAEEVARISFRKGGWPGNFLVILKDGTTQEIPFARTWSIFGSFFFTPPACLLCCDLTNELADISFGDAWLPELKASTKGISLIICRSEKAETLLHEAMNESKVELLRISKEDAIRAQRLGLYFKKKNYVARRRIWDRYNSASYAHNAILGTPTVRDFPLAILVLYDAWVSNARPFLSVAEKLPLSFFRAYNHFMYVCRRFAAFRGKP